jgi:hypothetical protein
MSGSSPVQFDYDFWITVYPEFSSTVNSVQGQEYFNLAGLYLDNTPCSVVPVLDVNGNPLRIRILGMITAQIAQLLAGSSIQPVSPLVGRISNAAEGSVNVATELNTPVEAAWFAQTRYGLLAWQALLPFRTATYIPGPRAAYGAYGYGYPGLYGFGGFPWPR